MSATVRVLLPEGDYAAIVQLVDPLGNWAPEGASLPHSNLLRHGQIGRFGFEGWPYGGWKGYLEATVYPLESFVGQDGGMFQRAVWSSPVGTFRTPGLVDYGAGSGDFTLDLRGAFAGLPTPPPTGILTPQFRCPYDGYLFGSQAELDEHLMRVHYIEKDQSGQTWYRCPVDGLLFSTWEELEAHLAEHEAAGTAPPVIPVKPKPVFPVSTLLLVLAAMSVLVIAVPRTTRR